MPSTSRRPRSRFSLGTLMLVMLVCSVTAAVGRYLVGSQLQTQSNRAIFVLAVLTLPVGLVIVANLALLVLRHRRRRR